MPSVRSVPPYRVRFRIPRLTRTKPYLYSPQRPPLTGPLVLQPSRDRRAPSTVGSVLSRSVREITTFSPTAVGRTSGGPRGVGMWSERIVAPGDSGRRGEWSSERFASLLDAKPQSVWTRGKCRDSTRYTSPKWRDSDTGVNMSPLQFF